MQEGDLANQNRVLTSWKEIAAYLGKGVRTVQRWEKDFGLPVRRPVHSDKSAILARTRDLDTWIAMRCCTRGLSDNEASHRRTMAIRSSLLASMNTAQLLRETNLALISEIRLALLSLRGEIARMQVGTRLSGTEASGLPAEPLTPSDELPITGAA